MTKRVYKSFPQSLIRNFKVSLTLPALITPKAKCYTR